MDLLARFALPAILALSAAGALIVATLLMRYGFASPEDEDPDDAEQRIGATRIAHALVAFCFAAVAVLAVAALAARSAPVSLHAGVEERSEAPAPRGDAPDATASVRESTPPAPRASAPASSRETTAPPASGEAAAGDREAATAQDEVRRVEARLRAEIAALEQRLAAASRERETERPDAAGERPDASDAPALPARGEARSAPRATAAPARPELQTKTTPPRRPAAVPAGQAAGAFAVDDVATMPAVVGAPQVRTTVQGVRVDVHRQPGGDRDTIYSIRLFRNGDRPLTGAEVSLRGHAADGAPVSAPLVPASEPGLYRARVASESPRGLRLRVVHARARFEVSLDQAVNW